MKEPVDITWNPEPQDFTPPGADRFGVVFSIAPLSAGQVAQNMRVTIKKGDDGQTVTVEDNDAFPKSIFSAGVTAVRMKYKGIPVKTAAEFLALFDGACPADFREWMLATANKIHEISHLPEAVEKNL